MDSRRTNRLHPRRKRFVDRAGCRRNDASANLARYSTKRIQSLVSAGTARRQRDDLHELYDADRACTSGSLRFQNEEEKSSSRRRRPREIRERTSAIPVSYTHL